MSINGLGAINNYQKYLKNNKANQTENVEKAQIQEVTREEFLQELKQLFPKMNITVGNITPSNAEGMAFGGSGIHNMAVSDKYFDNVLSDPAKRQEFKTTVRQAIDAKNQYAAMDKASGSRLVQSGFIIDSEGGMRSWSVGVRRSDGDYSDIDNGNSFGAVSSSSLKFGYQEILDQNKELLEKIEEKRAEKKKADKELQEFREEQKRIREQYMQNTERLEKKPIGNVVEKYNIYNNSGTNTSDFKA